MEGDPFSKGFTFCSWIYLESTKRLSSSGVQVEYAPVIFCFSGERQRLELRVKSNGLVLNILSHTNSSSLSSSSSKQQRDGSDERGDDIELNMCQVPERKWFMLSLTIAPGLINSEARVYFDRELREKVLLKYPRLPRLTNNELGRRSGTTSEGQAFAGNMGNIYLFGEPLSHNQIKALYTAGPNYLGLFRDFYVDGTIISSRSFLVSYSARAQRNGDSILNLISIDGDDEHILFNSAKTKNVETSSITTINDVISSAEGVFVLFPIILMLNNPPPPEYESPYSDKELLIFV